MIHAKRIVLMALSLLFLFIRVLAHGDELNIKPELLTKILAGKGEGELGFRESRGGGEGDTSPTPPAFFNDEIYIFDNLNWRICIFDLEMNYRREIRITGNKTSNSLQAAKLYVFENGDFSTSRSELLRIGKNGDYIYGIQHDLFPRNLTLDGEYYLFHDYVVYQKDNGELGAIDSNGKFLSNEETRVLHQDLLETNTLQKESPNLWNAITRFLSENNLVLVNDRFLSNRPKDYFDLYRIIRDNSSVQPKQSILDAKLRESSGYLYGFDNDHNSYWQFSIKSGQKEIITVFVVSRFGEIINRFRIDGNGYPIISPSGDVYLVEEKFEKNSQVVFLYYRVKRKW